MSAPRSLLDEVLPRFDANEVHGLWVPAPPQVVYAAMKQMTVREVRLLRALGAGRAAAPAGAASGLSARRLGAGAG